MLVIARRRGQKILIGDEIEITVTSVHRSSVKLGIRAPEHLIVRRRELAERDDDSWPPPPADE